MPYETVHMLVAAYLVGGFLVASVYAAGYLRGRRDRYHRLGFIIPFTVAAIVTPLQMVVGDQVARWTYNNEPVKFAALELVPKTASDVPETLFGHLNSQGPGHRRVRDPRARLDPLGSVDGHSDRRQGARHGAGERAADERRGQRRAPGVGRHGRHGDAAVPAVGLVRAGVAVPARQPEDEAVLVVRLRPRASRRSSRSRPAGSSPRSVANPGSSSTTTRSNRRRPRTRACGRRS